MKKAAETTTNIRTAVTNTRSPQQKFGTFEPEIWEPFQAFCDSRGMKTTSFLERVVRDAVGGRYIHLQMLKPEALDELERTADENGATIDLLVSQILSGWCVEKKAERKKKK